MYDSSPILDLVEGKIQIKGLEGQGLDLILSNNSNLEEDLDLILTKDFNRDLNKDFNRDLNKV